MAREPNPKVGDYLVYVPGCGDDDLYPTVDDARTAARQVKGADSHFPVYIVQVQEIV